MIFICHGSEREVIAMETKRRQEALWKVEDHEEKLNSQQERTKKHNTNPQ